MPSGFKSGPCKTIPQAFPFAPGLDEVTIVQINLSEKSLAMEEKDTKNFKSLYLIQTAQEPNSYLTFLFYFVLNFFSRWRKIY